MKPQQLSPSTELGRVKALVRFVRNSLPTAAVVTVAIASSVMLTLGGCASSAGIAPTAQTLAPASLGLEVASNAAPVDAVAADWWNGFGDPALTDLIDRTLVGNPTLKVAQARLSRAQAAIEGARAAEGLQINGALDVTRQHFSSTSIYPPPLGGSTRTLGTAQINASWEFDFFGRNRAALEATLGLQRAAQADISAARVMLAANVARTYVQLARLIDQREVAARSLKQRDDILALIRQRVQAGLDTTVELRQGEGALPESRQQIEQIDEQIALTRHALAALTAQPMDALDGLAPSLRAVKATPLPATVPADLIGRRADITAARWRIEAATSDIESAKAQFYPNINLGAFIGLSSIGLDRLVNAGSGQYGVGPAIRLPIFDSGRLRANLRGKTADLDAAVESYNAALIDAVHDVADQLTSLRSIDRQQAEQAQARTAAESAHDLSSQRYKAGLGTYLTVLNAEAGVLNQRRLAADLKARALDSQVALIRALGGGYSADADVASLAGAAAARP